MFTSAAKTSVPKRKAAVKKSIKSHA